MSRLQCRGSIALAAVVVALCWTTAADAQGLLPGGFGAPGTPREPGGLVNNLITGVEYDILNQKHAQRQLQHAQAKLSRDAENCNPAAMDRDARRIDNLQYRIAMDEWLIRWNSLYAPCFTPLRSDPVSLAAIAQASRPAPPAFPSQSVYMTQSMPPMALMRPAPTVLVTILNAEPTGPGVAFAIDGVMHQAAGGSRQELTVPANSNITYDSGGSLGQLRYQMSSGLYEFRSTPQGWALYKLPGTPTTTYGPSR